MDQTKIHPTIGRVVWYIPHDHENTAGNGDQPFSAMICYVWSEEMVNLSVNDANGNTIPRTSVPLFHGDYEDCPKGSCCWMPYQKSQAAKEAKEAA